MDFIIAPLVVGTIAYFIYMTFELFARRQERMKLIDKIGQNLTPVDPSVLKFEFGSLLPAFSKKSFISLRFGCLLTGLGLGLLVGLFLCLFIKSGFGFDNNYWERNTFYSVAYGASILLFGGLGLLVSYLIESKSTKKEEK
jgi:hypothetical protein